MYPFGFKPTRIFYDGDGGEGGEGGGNEGGTGESGGGNEGGQGGTQLPEGAFMADNFREALPEEIRGHAALAKIENIGDLGRSFVNAQQMIGKDPSTVVEIPTADKPEAIREVLGKLGAPADAGGYTLTPTEGAPDWLGVDQDMSKGFLDHAAKEGLLPSQTQNTYSWFTSVITEAAKEQNTKDLEASETNIRTLEAEFGGAFDQKIALVNHAIDKVGGEELRKVLNDAGVGTNPVVIKSYLQIASLFTEDNTGDGGGSASFGNKLSPDEARSKGRALLEQANRSPDMAERRRLNDEAQEFFQMASPGNVPATL